MPGRKKGRQRGSAGSKAQRARRWDNTMREARDDLALDRRAKLVRGGDSAPPRLSVHGFRSLATLLTQRVRANRAEEIAAMQSVNRAGLAPVEERAAGLVAGSASSAARISRCGEGVHLDRRDNRPPRLRTLLSLCINQIGKDFLAYRSDEENMAETFRLLPDTCLSRLSRAASAVATVCDDNVALLCSPSVNALWLRGSFSDQGADAVLPVLRNSGEDQDDKRTRSHGDVTSASARHTTHQDGKRTALADTRNKGCPSSTDHTVGVANGSRSDHPEQQVEVPVADSDCGFSPLEGDGGGEGERDEDWETADERIQVSLRGGVSLTTLDISSPFVSADFVKKLVLRIPTLQRLGLRGSLGVVGGPEAVCHYVPRLAALRELDVSCCSWFCDICLRRFAITLGQIHSTTVRHQADTCQSGITLERMTLEYVDETTSAWGAASTSTFEPLAPSTHNILGGEDGASIVHAPTGTGFSVGNGNADGPASGVEQVTRFRTFTLVCARTAVTDQGARVAEALAPGLLVVLEERSAVAGLHLAM